MSALVVVDTTAGAEGGLAALRAAATATVHFGIAVAVVGDPSVLAASLSEIPHDAERLTVVDRGRRSGLAAGLAYVARRPAAAFVTAAPAEAVVREAHRRLRRSPSIARTALASVVPTLRVRGAHDDPFALILDVGASASARSEDLVDFARMGAAYAGAITSTTRPRVGLLSPWASEQATPERLLVADAALRARSGSAMEYIGFVRGDQIPVGDADVVVTDGTIGSVVVQLLEGVAITGEQLLERARGRLSWRLGVSMLAAGVDRLRAVAEWESYGGAPLLGVDRTVIVMGRRNTERATLNGVRLAAKVERLGVRGRFDDPES